MRALIATVAILGLAGCAEKNPMWSGAKGMESCGKFAAIEKKLSTTEGRDVATIEDYNYSKSVASWLKTYLEWERTRGDRKDIVVLNDLDRMMIRVATHCEIDASLEIRQATYNAVKEIVEDNASK